ncbi:MAG: hypothetical protein R3258_10900 [Acidimicrobiia bacterium]|nr:hypothetical protein [Acidimicrobiia bacterium]
MTRQYKKDPDAAQVDASIEVLLTVARTLVKVDHHGPMTATERDRIASVYLRRAMDVCDER